MGTPPAVSPVAREEQDLKEDPPAQRHEDQSLEHRHHALTIPAAGCRSASSCMAGLRLTLCVVVCHQVRPSACVKLIAAHRRFRSRNISGRLPRRSAASVRHFDSRQPTARLRDRRVTAPTRVGQSARGTGSVPMTGCMSVRSLTRESWRRGPACGGRASQGRARRCLVAPGLSALKCLGESREAR
jgi:hypothetical protein